MCGGLRGAPGTVGVDVSSLWPPRGRQPVQMIRMGVGLGGRELEVPQRGPILSLWGGHGPLCVFRAAGRGQGMLVRVAQRLGGPSPARGSAGRENGGPGRVGSVRGLEPGEGFGEGQGAFERKFLV